MNWKLNWKPLFAGLLAAGLLSGCAAGTGPVQTLPAIDPQPAPTETARNVTVNSVQELTDAIAPGAVITLPEGLLKLDPGEDLDTGNEYCWWQSVYDGYELVISGVDGLTIQGAGVDATRVQTDPRYAAVLKFENCQDLKLQGFTAGHTEMAQACEGNVINLGDCRNVSLQDLGLFGCGNTGVYAELCENLTVRNCDIYSCSSMGLNLGQVKGCKIIGCTIRDLGEQGSEAFCAVLAWEGSDLSIEDTVFSGNYASSLLSLSQDAAVSGCTFKNNALSDAVFAVSSSMNQEFATLTLENCLGQDNKAWAWTRTDAGCDVVDETGNSLDDAALNKMFGTVAETVTEPTQPQQTVTVTNTDEFLAAIGSNREIVIDCPELDLSQAADYGQNGESSCYSWDDPLDGPQLTIQNVDNLTIRGKDGKDANLISAVPRYAQVLSFRNCTNVTIKDLTAGHTKEPGICMGGVLEFQNCSNVTVSGTGLFGCGTIGVDAIMSRNLDIRDNEIYECSFGGVRLNSSRNVTMENNDFHDLGGEYVGFVYNVSTDCEDVTFNGTQLAPGDQLEYHK